MHSEGGYGRLQEQHRLSWQSVQCYLDRTQRDTPRKSQGGHLKGLPESLPAYILKQQYHMYFISQLFLQSTSNFSKTHHVSSLSDCGYLNNFILHLHRPGFSLTVNSHTSSCREGHFWWTIFRTLRLCSDNGMLWCRSI